MGKPNRYKFVRETENRRYYYDRLNGRYVETGRGDNDLYVDNDEVVDSYECYEGDE